MFFLQIVEFNIQIDKRRPMREEMFSLKNKHCQAAFKEATESNPELINSFENDLLFAEQSKKWKRVFNSLLHKCFKKVRIVGNQKRRKKRKVNFLKRSKK